MKKRIRRIAVCGIALVLLLTLAGCRKASPSDIVKKDLQNIKTEKVSEVQVPFIDEQSADSKGLKDKYRSWVKMVQKFDYKIGKTTINEKKKTATVRVTIKTYDFGNAYKAAYDQVIADAKAGTVTSATDIEQYTFNMMFDKMAALKDKSYKKTVVIKLKQNDDKEWTSDLQSNSDFIDAMLGGMMTQISSLTSGQ